MANFDVPPDIAKNVVLRHIWNETHEAKKNQIIITGGLPRTGKSELDVCMAWNLYRGSGKDFEHRFEVAKHCKWSKLDFQKLVQENKDVGAAIMWDEAGIAELGAHARQFWSEGNIAMSTLFQIMGFHRQVALISLPMKIMLDKHLRMLSHVDIETFKVKAIKNKCIAKVKWLEMSSSSGKAYGKYPRYISSDGLRYRVKTLEMPRAPKEIRDEYIIYSEVFKQWLEQKLIKDEELRRHGRTETQSKSVTQRIGDAVKGMLADEKEYCDQKGEITWGKVNQLHNLTRHNALEAIKLFKQEKEGVS